MLKEFVDIKANFEDGKYGLALDMCEWVLTFSHRELPVCIAGKNSDNTAIVTLGSDTTDVCIKFPIDTKQININELIQQAKDILDDYLEDYERGIN